MNNRLSLLNQHSNDYGFNPQEILLDYEQAPRQNLSIIIPYFNTGLIFERVLYFIDQAATKCPGKVEVIVVDDCSEAAPPKYDLKLRKINIKIVKHSKNRGRTASRNTGLKYAKEELVLFMDSDILIHSKFLLHHLILQEKITQTGHKGICASLFEFINKTDSRIHNKTLDPIDIQVNDFRLKCVYEETWIGCEEDKKFIGEEIEIIKSTNYFRSWSGKYKAWMLPNMVLGGAFSVDREEIECVGGFDRRFKGYGFTETSAVTKMIAERGCFLIPIAESGALHIEDKDINLTKIEKDILFKIKHDFYFNTFLKEDVTW